MKFSFAPFIHAGQRLMSFLLLFSNFNRVICIQRTLNAYNAIKAKNISVIYSPWDRGQINFELLSVTVWEKYLRASERSYVALLDNALDDDP